MRNIIQGFVRGLGGLGDKMKKGERAVKHVTGEMRRLLWAGAGVLISQLALKDHITDPWWALRAHRFLSLSMAVIFAMLLRSQLFPYIHLKAMYDNRDPRFGTVLLAQCILMSAIIYALTAGL